MSRVNSTPAWGLFIFLRYRVCRLDFFLAGFAMDFFVWVFPKIYILAILLPFSIFYSLMTGWTASVLRSLIQSLLAECGIKKSEQYGHNAASIISSLASFSFNGRRCFKLFLCLLIVFI